jgi:CHASE3 domain sensor protein
MNDGLFLALGFILGLWMGVQLTFLWQRKKIRRSISEIRKEAHELIDTLLAEGKK